MLTKLIDLGYVGTGTTPSMKNPGYYDSDDIPFIKPSDINDNEVSKITKSVFFISNKARQKARLFPKNTILCVCIGSIGKIGITTKESSCNQQINYIIPNDKHNAKFLAYSLLFRKDELIRIGSDGTVVPIINKSLFENIEIKTFDYDKETKIAGELDSIKANIDLKLSIITELDELVKSQFIEMFGDPIQNEKAWDSSILNEVTDVRDGTHDSPKYHDRGYPFVTSKNLIDGKIDFSTCQFISEKDYLHFNDRSRIDDGDILMPMIGTIGGAIIVKKDREFSIKNVALLKFTKDNTKINRTFILYILNSDSMNNYFELTKKGGTQKFIALGVIRNIPIIVPPIELQNEFAKFVNQIDKSKYFGDGIP